ncbi:hypothetical protein [Thiocapsa rosea]|nr:hypothetical protein [Thiocapsa rosea]
MALPRNDRGHRLPQSERLVGLAWIIQVDEHLLLESHARRAARFCRGWTNTQKNLLSTFTPAAWLQIQVGADKVCIPAL